jgi:hypothetical protein
VLHTRDHFLADIAALLEADAIGFVEQNIMREGIAKLVVTAALDDAVGDAQRLPCLGVADVLCFAAIAAPDRHVAKAHVGKRC